MEKLYKDALTRFTELQHVDNDDNRQDLINEFEGIKKKFESVSYKSSVKSNNRFMPYPSLGKSSAFLSKKEFRRCAQTENDAPSCNKHEYSLTKPQTFARSFISPYTPYNGILIYHGLGVGKTCAAIQIAESFKNVFENKALVIASPLLQDSFKSKLYEHGKGETQCVGTKYMNASFESHYEFLGYDKFANQIENFEKMHPKDFKQQIHDRFSNRVIIIDEAHNMRKVQNKNKNISRKIELVLRIAHNIKLVLMTGTPIYNDMEELQFIMELMYTNDKNFEMVERIRKEVNKEMLVDFAKRYVSYVRGENPFTFPAKLWPKESTITNMPTIDYKGQGVKYKMKHTPLVVSPLSKQQEIMYKKITSTIIQTDMEDDLDVNHSTYMQATNIVYPNFVIGHEGFTQCFQQLRSKAERSTFTYKTDEEFLHPKHLHKYSSKMSKILESVSKSEGISLVFSNVLWFGIIPIAFALEHSGFTNLRSNLLTCKNKEKANGMKYIIITGTSGLGNDLNKVLPILNSPENKNGELIKVVLFTSAGAEGLDYKNVREIHLLEPWYNMSKIDQIVGRGIRNCSHEMLPKEKRNCLVYLHACTCEDGKKECADLTAYRKAEEKQVYISQVERVLKENAIDCPLNHDVLVFPNSKFSKVKMVDAHNNTLLIRPGDQDNSKVCDFTKCAIDCANGKLPPHVDESTFERFFIERDIENCVRKIKRLFENKIAFTYEEIRNLVQDEDLILKYALGELGNVVYDGKVGYIIYRSNMYIFQPLTEKNTKLTLTQRQRLGIEHNGEKTKVLLEPKFASSSNILEVLTESIRQISILYPEMSHEIIIDYVIDTLNEQQFINLCKVVSNGEYKDSLLRGFVIVDKDLFFNYFTNKYMDSNGNEVSDYTIKKVRMEHVKHIKSLVSNTQIAGFIQIKDKKPIFKIVEGSNKKGVVCKSFPQLKKEELMSRINKLDSTLDVSGTKEEMCIAYELALRASNTTILRPAMYQISNSKSFTLSK